MARKITALIMALVLSLGIVTHAAYFSDLQDGSYSWAKDTINKLADDGIIKGYSDGTYGPARQITRQEAFTLFARAAGVNDSANAYGVEFNQFAYKVIADKYNTYAKKELCFMLERGILSENEVGEYLSEENKNRIMLRHEAAVLISKILDIRNGFDEYGEYLLDFTDVNDIPDSSMAAVGFASAEGILNGMADGSFSPNTGVTRAQIAIMLDRIIERLDIKYTTGTITAIEEFYDNILEVDGTEYVFDEKTIYSVNGNACSCSDLKVGDSVTIVYIHSGAWAVEAVRPDEFIFEQIRGNVKSATSSTITLENGNEYGVSAFLVCYENGIAKKYNEMNFANPVRLEVVNGFVRRIEGTGDLYSYEDVKIAAIITLPERTLKFEADGAEMEFAIADDAVITKNGYAADIKNLSTKDLAYVLIDNGVISRIAAYTDFAGGVAAVKQIVIDENESSVVLDINGGERFRIDNDIVFADENNQALTIYDLRLGDTVTPLFEAGNVSVLRYGI